MTIIEVEALSKRYGDTLAVDDVSFSVEEQMIFGILGRNGAGKTTLVECIEGLRVSDEGRVSVMGLDPRHERHQVREVLGAQLQQTKLPDRLRVGEILRLFRSFYREGEDPDQLLEVLGLSDKRHTYAQDLSGGQQQRVSVALALISAPRIVVLDELTTGLDPQARRETWQFIERIRDRGVTIVLVSHFMDEVERLCDRVAIMDGGQLVALDTPAGLVRHAGDEQRIWFRPSRSIDTEELVGLAQVTAVDQRDGQVVVSGRDGLIQAVVMRLDEAGVRADELRVEQPTLEDAFVALTGRSVKAGREE